MLTDIAVRKAATKDKPYKLSDSRGLYLVINPNGSKLWRFDYKFEAKRKTASFGKYPEVGLAEARNKHQDFRKMVGGGVDPLLVKKQERAAVPTFAEVGRRWLAKQRKSWVPKYYGRIEKRLEDDIFTTPLGLMVITDIEPPELLKYIRRIENRGALETARRISNHCGAIFRFGIAEGICQRDPSADIRDAFEARPAVRHQPSIAEKELPEFLSRMNSSDLEDDTHDALLMVLLTIGRTDEIRFADADEFEDLDEAEPMWRIPPARMKMSRPHLVPLSRQAVEVVKRRLAKNPRGLLFARDTVSKTISENTMLYALYRMGYHSRATVHGLRGTFSTIAHENEWESDWIEMCLAHDQDNKVKAAYNSAKYLKQRRTLLQWWADYLDQRRAAAG